MSYGNEACEYDSLGNPTTYRGKALKWSHIKHLREYDNVSFDYNANGIRTRKSVNGTNFKYIYSDNKLLAEIRENIIKSGSVAGDGVMCGCDEVSSNSNLYAYTKHIQYLHGVNGIAGFITEGKTYYYRKNLQGDVIQIVDSTGAIKAEYAYDAWGNHKIITDVGGIGKLNPFRYRGYYYDVETGLFYLQNRYYDPQVGRFLNMDSIDYLQPERLNGLNLYSYCGNNPVMYLDSIGRYPVHIFVARQSLMANNNFQPNNFIDSINHFLINNSNEVFKWGANILNIITVGLKGTSLFNISGYAAKATGLLAIGASWFNNFYNSNLTLQEKFTHSIVDTAYVGLSVAVTTGVTALFSLIPGIGILAPIVGIGAGLLVDWIWKDLGVGDFIKNTFNDFVSWLGNLFGL